MSKKNYSMICDQINQNNGQGSVRFVMDPVDQPVNKPGEAPARTVRTVIQVVYSTAKEAAGFIHGKTYPISIGDPID
jgi:hypothetical protein